MFDGDYPIGIQGNEDAIAPFRDWLAQLCLCVPHVKEGFGYFPPHRNENAAVEPIAYPEHARTTPDILAALTSAAKTRKVGFQYFSRNGEELCAIVCCDPQPGSGWKYGVDGISAVAVVVPRFEPEQLEALARLIKSNFAWLELMLQSPARSAEQSSLSNDATVETTRAPQLNASAIRWLNMPDVAACERAIVNDLATDFGCERVILNHIHQRHVDISAISGLAKPDPRQRCNQVSADLCRATAAYGDGLYWSYGQYENGLGELFADHKKTAKVQDFAVLIHTSSNDAQYGIVFEWSAGNDSAVRSFAQTNTLSEATISKPITGLEILGLRTMAEPTLVSRMLASSTAYLQRCVGKRHLKSKLIFLAVIALVSVTTLVPFDFKIAAPITLEGATQRAVVAPFESYIRAAHVEAGMTVLEGEALVELDRTKLELELDKWQSEKSKLAREYDRALAELNHSEAQIIRAQLGQAQAELNLVNNQLAQTTLSAPFDGVVISGDLRSSLGAPTARGELLLEIAPLAGYRVVLSVDERDIAHVQTAQTGTLTLNSMPGKRWPFEIVNVASAAPSEDGKHLFRVEAALSQAGEQFRPGMQGIGKIEVGKESLAYLLSRRLLGWLRLNLWAKMP